MVLGVETVADKQGGIFFILAHFFLKNIVQRTSLVHTQVNVPNDFNTTMEVQVTMA